MKSIKYDYANSINIFISVKKLAPPSSKMKDSTDFPVNIQRVRKSRQTELIKKGATIPELSETYFTMTDQSRNWMEDEDEQQYFYLMASNS